MAKKEAIHSKVAPDSSHHFNWGLIVSEFSELFVLTGRVDGDAEDNCLHLRRPGRTDQGHIRTSQGPFGAKRMEPMADVIRIDICVTKGRRLCKE